MMAMSVSLLSAMRDTATPGPFCVTQCLPCDYHLRQRRSGHTRDPCTSCSPAHSYRGVGDNVHVPVPRVYHLLLLGLRVYGEMLQMPDLRRALSHHSRQHMGGTEGGWPWSQRPVCEQLPLREWEAGSEHTTVSPLAGSKLLLVRVCEPASACEGRREPARAGCVASAPRCDAEDDGRTACERVAGSV